MTDHYHIPPEVAETLRGKTIKEVMVQEGLDRLGAAVLVAFLEAQDDEDRRVQSLSN